MHYNINSSCCTPLAFSFVVFDLDYMDFAARPPPPLKNILLFRRAFELFHPKGNDVLFLIFEPQSQ